MIKNGLWKSYFFLVFELSTGGLNVASLPMTMIMVAKTLSSSFLSSFLLSLFAGDLFKVTSTTAVVRGGNQFSIQNLMHGWFLPDANNSVFIESCVFAKEWYSFDNCL